MSLEDFNDITDLKHKKIDENLFQAMRQVLSKGDYANAYCIADEIGQENHIKLFVTDGNRSHPESGRYDIFISHWPESNNRYYDKEAWRAHFENIRKCF